ncbi:hypothetical protein [Alkalimarinus alittae]|nr:hypothetical protein [Alkalimarinus alittae]
MKIFNASFLGGGASLRLKNEHIKQDVKPNEAIVFVSGNEGGAK